MSSNLSADLTAALESLVKAEITLLNAESAVEEARQCRNSADEAASRLIEEAFESTKASYFVGEVDFHVQLNGHHFHVRLHPRPVQAGWDFGITSLVTPSQYVDSLQKEARRD